MTILGIDPGLSGALAAHAGTHLIVRDMPTFALTRGGKNKREIDCVQLVAIVRELNAREAWLEQVSSMPGQGVSSVFAFGQAFGIIKGILAALNVPLHLVTPRVWKKALNVPAAKDGARARASQLMPWAAEYWPLVKHDGRAEAALIALYGVSQYQPRELW